MPHDYIIPAWLDQAQGVDYTPEKQILTNLETWAFEKGWEVTNGSTLPFDLSQRTDVMLKKPNSDRRIRVAILRKKGNRGSIRLDTSNLRTFELVYRPRAKKWRLEVSAVPLAEDMQAWGWDRLADLAFKP